MASVTALSSILAVVTESAASLSESTIPTPAKSGSMFTTQGPPVPSHRHSATKFLAANSVGTVSPNIVIMFPEGVTDAFQVTTTR